MSAYRFPILAALVVSLGALTAHAEAINLRADRKIQSLGRRASDRARLKKAAAKLKDRVIELASVKVDRTLLEELAATPEDEPLVRAVREKLRLPVDLEDFILFLDDVAYRKTPPVLVVTSGRARRAGILLHPDDVFKKRKPREYGKKRNKKLRIDRPVAKEQLPPAKDGALLGPEWYGRYPNPETDEEILALLEKHAPDFAARMSLLVEQLKAQGAWVTVTSGYRYRERGFLMWGAFILSRAKTKKDVDRALKEIDEVASEHGLNVPIKWRHPDGWKATKEAATKLAEAYEVVYATRHGALESDHYDAAAVDVVVTGLPRSLSLKAPDGAERTFDLSAPEQSRDLSLSPELIDWVEEHFLLVKLKPDYPHWNDKVALDKEKAEREAKKAAEKAARKAKKAKKKKGQRSK